MKVLFHKSWRRTAVPFFLKLNHLAGNYKSVVWLVGDGRSGTTWVSNLLNFDNTYREMFEPFHPTKIKQMGFLNPHLYVRPGERNERLEEAAREIFSGAFTHPRVDLKSTPKRYRGLLVKDIFSNLFTKWAYEKFPDIKIVLLIRHPFSVALSKVKTQGKNWFWGSGPGDLFKQELLLDDFLGPFQNVYKTTKKDNDPFLNMVLLWAVINYVPLKQFSNGQLHVVFYENILMNPDKEISRLLRLVGKSDVKEKSFLPQTLISKPSWVSGSESNHIKGIPLIGSWKNELTRKQIYTGMGILDQFGLSSLYNEECMPEHNKCKLTNRLY